jgi:hypothetical protein
MNNHSKEIYYNSKSNHFEVLFFRIASTILLLFSLWIVSILVYYSFKNYN